MAGGKLHIEGRQPIVMPQQANLAVRNIKNHISDAVESTGAKQVDLFIAGPSFLALFLGHRLNATIGRVLFWTHKPDGASLARRKRPHGGAFYL